MSKNVIETKGITIPQCRQLREVIREATGTTDLLSENDYQMILSIVAIATDRYMRNNGVLQPLT